MTVLAGYLTFVGDPFKFALSFARQPEPDLEFTEEELDQTTATRPMSPMKQPKKSGGRPLLWMLLLALIGGVAYVAMEPEQLTEWLAPFLGEGTPKQTSPPVAMQPKAPAEPAAVPPSPPTTTLPSDDMGPAPSPPAEAAAPSAPPASPAPPAALPPGAPPASPTASAPAPTPPARTTSSPLFAEGQRVTVMGNPTAPAEMVPLTLDPAGTKPGPAVRPGVTLSILDGDLQPSGWVYSVRSDDGVNGWVAEKRLRMKF